MSPVQTPDRTKLWVEGDQAAHSVVLPAELQGRLKAVTYDQIEDILSNRPGPIFSTYLTLAQKDENNEPMFPLDLFIDDLRDCQSKMVEQFTLVRDWYENLELHFSGVEHPKLAHTLKILLGIGLPRQQLDDTMRADKVFQKYVGPDEESGVYTYSFRDPANRERIKSCPEEHAVLVLLDDLIQKARMFNLETGTDESFATEVFQSAVAVMFVLRAAIPEGHPSLKGTQTDATRTEEVREVIEEEVRELSSRRTKK